MTVLEFEQMDKQLEEYWSDELDSVAKTLILREWRSSTHRSLEHRASKGDCTVDQYRHAWIYSWDVTRKLFEALHSNAYSAGEADSPKYFWHHQKFDVLRTNDAKRGMEIDKDCLLQGAAFYLSHPEIRTNMLDWLFLDSIVFAELDAYAHEAFTTRGGTGTNWAAIFAERSELKYYTYQWVFGLFALVLNYVAAPALGYYLALRGHLTGCAVVIGVWILWLGLRLMSYPYRRRARKKAGVLLQHLIDLYRVIGDNTISPRRLKEELDKATAEGVVLDGAVSTIVDRLMARDVTAFIPTEVG